MSDEMTPIPVFVSNPEPAAPKPQFRTVYNLVTIQTAGRAHELLAPAMDRYCAFVFPLDDDIILDSLRSDATAGKGGAYIPKTVLVPWQIFDSGAVYCAAPTIAGASSRVTVIDVHYAK